MPYVLASAGFTPPGPSSFWHPLIGDGAFAVTRSMFVVVATVIIIGLVMTMTAKRLQLVPTKGQFAVESLYNIARNQIGVDFIGEARLRPFLPLLVSLFLFILLNNLAGIIPFVQFPSMSRFGYVVVLTLIVYVVYHYVGLKKKGFGGYFRGFLPPGVPIWLVPVVYPLELLTYFVTRPLTLSLRLFANMFAGHTLLLVFALGGEYLLLHSGNVFLQATSVASFVMFIAMTFFELLIQFLQAYIFVLLTAYYIADAMAEEH